MKHRLLATEMYHSVKDGTCDLDRLNRLIREYSEGDISALELLEVAALVNSWVKSGQLKQETKELPNITEVIKNLEQRLKTLEDKEKWV